MVVGFGHADAAEGAVFAASGLGELASSARVVGPVKNVVVRVVMEACFVVEGRDVVGGVSDA